MQRALLPLLFLSLALLLGGCNRGGQVAGTTTTSEPEAAAITTTTTTTTAGEDDGEASSPTTVPSRPEYTIYSRMPGDSGDTVVVILEPGDYTDVQIENVIRDVVETFAPIKEAHLVDSQEAADAVLVDEPTAEQEAILEEHYLARLEEGARLVYLGPYAEHGSKILGS